VKLIGSWAAAVMATDVACGDDVLLPRFAVLSVIDDRTRGVHVAGITTNPTGPCTTRAARTC
jgi:hypothetical protein